MADENNELTSLDFTVPGAFKTPPAETVAPERAAPPAAPPPPRLRPSLPPALAEAAALYVAGKELDAMRRLESAIKSGEDLGDAELLAWGGLFDLLQALGRRPAFEALALTFARRFEKSPPTWNAAVDDQNATNEATGGRASVSLNGVLDAGVGEVLKQAMKLAATSTLVRIDVAKLTAVDPSGATLLMRAIAALKRAKKEFVFGSPEHLAEILAAKLAPGDRCNEPMWLLLLELHQQAGRQEAFEEAAVNYAITFEVSPPSWEPPPKRHEQPRPPPSSPSPKAQGFSLGNQLLDADAGAFASLEAALAGRDEFDIDGRTLVRIDALSARHFLEVLTRLSSGGKKLRIVGLSTLVAAFLETQGFAKVVELQARTV